MYHPWNTYNSYISPHMLHICKKNIDSILFSVFTLIALSGIFFHPDEKYLYPIISFFYLRIWYLIYVRHCVGFNWWVRPKEYFKPFLLGWLFWFATWWNFYIFGEFYDIPIWMKKEQAFLWTLLHVSIQEIIFRSYFFIAFEKIFHKYMLIFMSATVFFMIHLFLPGISIFLIFLYISGIFWSWLFYKYRNLYANIFSHFLINAGAPYILLVTL